MDSHYFRIDGQSKMNTFPASYTEYVDGGNGKTELFTINYNTQGTLVDKATSEFQRHIVHLSLPMGDHMEVLRWDNYLDLRIRMPKVDGMDGACGNFNGNAADDTTTAIIARVGARVAPSDLLFDHEANVVVTQEMHMMLQNDCN